MAEQRDAAYVFCGDVTVEEERRLLAAVDRIWGDGLARRLRLARIARDASERARRDLAAALAERLPGTAPGELLEMVDWELSDEEPTVDGLLAKVALAPRTVVR